jgi:hypothetical protein
MPAQERAVTADYLRKQARKCLDWARDCFDLSTATRLRLMADEFNAKAAEIESSRCETAVEPRTDPRHALPFQIRGNAA